MFASKTQGKAAADSVTVRAQVPAPAVQRRGIAPPDAAHVDGATEVGVEDEDLRIDRLAQHMTLGGASASLPSPWDLVRVPPSRGALSPAIGSMTVPSIQRTCSTCRDEEDVLQRAALTPSETTDPTPGTAVGDGETIQRQHAGVEPDDELDEREEYEDREEQDDRVQKRLTISQPDDPYEREADLVAEAFVGDAAPAAAGPSAGEPRPEVQRACDECTIEPATPEEAVEDAEQEVSEEPSDVSPKREPGAAAPRAARGLDAGFASARADARPLPGHVRQDMERGFGQDFGSVRIHVGHYASAMCRAIRAKAFTHRQNVYFNAGQFTPATGDGRRLLAHELTHVVQQTGARSVTPMLQRAFYDEPKIGNWAHARIQAALRGRDKKLITEAPIPGAIRKYKGINLVGFADFYKAEGQAISGISAQEPKASKEGLASQAKYKYVKMRQDWIDRADSNSRVVPGPVLNRGRWNFSTNFPKNFQVAELKPLFPAEFPGSFVGIGTAGSATIQTGNYREGFPKFVERVYQDNPAQQKNLPPTITGRPLVISESNIPPAINYNQFDQQRQNAAAGAILKKDKEPHKRIWIYPLAQGLYVYFLLPHPYTAPGFPESVTQQLTQLEPLLRRLRARRTAINNQLMPKRESSASLASRASAGLVQRKEDPWRVAAKDWETSRRAWVSGTGGGKPKEFLKAKARGPLRKAKIDKELKLKATGKLGEQVRNVKSIKFWSSFRGRILGALRFRFGHVFDKVEEWFEKLKAKFRKHRASSDKLVTKNGVFSGWKKVATAAIIKFSVVIFKEMLVTAFRSFINCINGVVAAILDKFTWAVDEARQEIMEEVQPVCCQVIEFKHKAEDEFKKHDEVIAAFTEAIETIREWRQILDAVETAIRVGVQIVSCGTPPALGCLWGLVAQLGISTGLSLLARTDYFEEEIAKPAARSLMNAIVGDSLHNFLIDLLAKTPLEPFLAEAADCQKRRAVTGSTTIGGNLDKLDPNLPANAKARAEWEREMGPQILRDLQAVFQKGKGQPVSKQDLQKLVDALKDHKATPEQIKAMFEAARDPKSGKLAIEKAAANLAKGEVPDENIVERNIDYAKATKSNVYFQRALGWKPTTFYPKPGVRVDSEEFANAVYDMQGALGFKKPDGILGEQTLLAFYDQNKRKPDAAYNEATRVVEERRKKKEKAEQERQEKLKPKMREGEIEIEPESRGPSVIQAIQVEKPADASKIIGQDWIASSPGWVSVPMGEIQPAKSSYQPGERISVHALHWIKQQWVVFPDIPAEFKSSVETSSPTFGDNLVEILYLRRENLYFKLSADDETVYEQRKGTMAVYVRKQ